MYTYLQFLKYPFLGFLPSKHFKVLKHTGYYVIGVVLKTTEKKKINDDDDDDDGNDSDNRDLKHRRQGRQRERQKTIL